MKKILNDSEHIVRDMLSGVAKAYSHKLNLNTEENVLYRSKIEQDKVGIIIGNGSGHEPACIGFVGKNMLDANIAGGIFAAPGPYGILEGIRITDRGNGVCVIISQHAGDILNSKMGIDMAEDEGFVAKPLIVHDDVASAPIDELLERRGTIGTIFVYKMVGGYAAEGHSLEEILKFGKSVVFNSRSIGMANYTGTSPVNGKIMFELADDEIEIGLGVHGEAAVYTVKTAKSKVIAKLMAEKLIEDKPFKKGDEISVIVNGMGQTTQAELLVFYNDIDEILREKGIKVFRPLIGTFVTSQEMGGIALSFCKLTEEMKKQWIKDTDAVSFPKL